MSGGSESAGHSGDGLTADDEGKGHWWQMPQGGIDGNEDPALAASRELAEETAITSAEIIAEAPEWYKYDLPGRLASENPGRANIAAKPRSGSPCGFWVTTVK